MRSLILVIFLFVFMGCKKESSVPQKMRTISPGMAHNLILQQLGNKDFQILDVRTKKEFVSGHIDQSINIDYINQKEALLGLNPKTTYLIYCKSGRRSRLAAEFLNQNGFHSLFNIEGGIDQWKKTFKTLTPSPLNEL